MPNTDPLVIVLGAGASKEVNLPIGSELTKSIAESLNFKLHNYQRLAGGDDLIRECVYKLSAQSSASSRGTADDYYRTALKIREAMPLALSIDNFIDSHRMDERIAQVGKIAIAACILKAEKRSTLYLDRSNIYNKLDFTPLGKTWFASLFSLVTQHCSRNELSQQLSRLTIISFNYDRCFKHFLRYALLTYYSLSQPEADAIVSKVSVLHPYGSVGRMPFETERSAIDYGEQPTSDDLMRSAGYIKTFTESTDHEAAETKAIRESVTNTKTLVFLGFAFHPLNLELLFGQSRPKANSRNCDVFGTAMDISDSSKSLIVDDLAQMGGYAASRIQLHQKLTAGALISEYSRHLSRSLRSSV
jgi:hypothetical protein